MIRFTTSSGEGGKAKKKDGKEGFRKQAIVMDEVDGMGGSDRGGIQELIGLIKKSKVPIIAICNDRQHQKIRFGELGLLRVVGVEVEVEVKNYRRVFFHSSFNLCSL